MELRCISTWMSTGSVRSCGPAGPPVSTSVTYWPFSNSRSRRPEPTVVAGRAARAGGPARRRLGSDVEEPHVLGVALDERPARLHVLAHEHAEQLVGLRRVVQRDLEQ